MMRRTLKGDFEGTCLSYRRTEIQILLNVLVFCELTNYQTTGDKTPTALGSGEFSLNIFVSSWFWDPTFSPFVVYRELFIRK
jgi:hypothetical protein